MILQVGVRGEVSLDVFVATCLSIDPITYLSIDLSIYGYVDLSLDSSKLYLLMYLRL